MWKWSGNTGAESLVPDPVYLQANSHLLCHFINDKHRLQNSCVFLNKNSFLCTKHAQSMQAKNIWIYKQLMSLVTHHEQLKLMLSKYQENNLR